MSDEFFGLANLTNLTNLTLTPGSMTHGSDSDTNTLVSDEPKHKKKTEIFIKSKPNMHELEILPIKSAATLNPLKGKHPNLIKPPFLMLINGSVRSGKSCLITNLVFRDSFYKGIWQKVFLITPTAYSDPSYKVFLESENVIVFCPTSRDELNAAISSIMGQIEKDEQNLIIFDDIVGLVSPGDNLTKLSTKYRHYGLSIIIACQYYMRLNVTIRSNATCYIIFKVQNTKELDNILSELGTNFDKLEQKYNKVFNTNKPFTFLVLDLRNRILMHEFKEVI